MSEPQEKKRKSYCCHCDKEVSKSTWYLHYNQYFDQVTGEWKRSAPPQPSSFKFSEDSSPEPEGDFHDNFLFDADDPSVNVSF